MPEDEGNGVFEMAEKEEAHVADDSKKVYVADGKINSQAAAKKNRMSRKQVEKCFRYCEIVTITLVILIIGGLFLIPTVLYLLPESEVSKRL